MRRSLAVLSAICGLLFGLPVAAQATTKPVAHTDAGWVRGADRGDVRVYQGVPYAAPPVGDLRWHSPEPPARWSGVRAATTSASACPQAPSPGRTGSVNEDCLYLDVTAPRRAHKLPVMVWIHGGGLMTGAGSEYDPTRLVTRGDMVVVTFNYRLGNFGFFGFPGLANGGAFGIEDQQAALRWVRRNIAEFGGDPRNVTLAGESAGAHSVCAQLASPGAAGLFQHAIGQSTPCVANALADADFRPLLDVPYFIPPDWQEGHGANTAALLGCADLACLRGKPTEDLLAAPAFPLPAYGNAVLPEDPAVAVPAGRFNHVPFLTGITRDEGTLFAPLLFPGLTPEGYLPALTARFGDRAAAVAAQYPLAEHEGSAVQAMAAIASDLDWAHAQSTADRRFAAQTPTYAYEFLDRTAPQILEFPPGVTPLASHGSDVQYLFDMTIDDRPLTAAQRRLGDRMVEYWARFAKTGNPNARGLASWPKAPYVQGLGLGRVGPFDRVAAHKLSFWQSQIG